MDINLMTGQVSKDVSLAEIGDWNVLISYTNTILTSRFFQSRTQADFGTVGASWRLNCEAGFGSVQLVGSLLDPSFELTLQGTSFKLEWVQTNSNIVSYRVLGRDKWKITYDSTLQIWYLLDDSGKNFYFGDRLGIAIETGQYDRKTGSYSMQSAGYANLLGIIRTAESNPNFDNVICSSVTRKVTTTGALNINPTLTGQAFSPIKWHLSSVEDNLGHATWFYYAQHLQSPFDNDASLQGTLATYLYRIEERQDQQTIKNLVFDYSHKGDEETVVTWIYGGMACDPMQQERQLLYLSSVTVSRGDGQVLWQRQLITNINRDVRGFADFFTYRELYAIDHYAPNALGTLSKLHNVATFTYYGVADIGLKSTEKIFELRKLFNPQTGGVLALLKSAQDASGILTQYRYDSIEAVTRSYIYPSTHDFEVTDSQVFISNRGFYILQLYDKPNNKYTVVFVQWTGLAFASQIIYDAITPVSNYTTRDWTLQVSANTIAIVSPDFSQFQLLVKGFSSTFELLITDEYKKLGGNTLTSGSIYLDDRHLLVQNTTGSSYSLNHLRFDTLQNQWILAKQLTFQPWHTWLGQFIVVRIGNFLVACSGFAGPWYYTLPADSWPHDPYPVSSPAFEFITFDWTKNYAQQTQSNALYGATLMQSTHSYPIADVYEEWDCYQAGSTFNGFNGVSIHGSRVIFRYMSDAFMQYDWDVTAHGKMSVISVDDWGTIFNFDYTSGLFSLPFPQILNATTQELLWDHNVNFAIYDHDDDYTYTEPTISASFVPDGLGGAAYHMSYLNMKVDLDYADQVVSTFIGCVGYIANIPNVAQAGLEIAEIYPASSSEQNTLQDVPPYQEVKDMTVAVTYKDAMFMSVDATIVNTWTEKNQSYIAKYYYMDLTTGLWSRLYTGMIQNVSSTVTPNAEGESIKKGFDLFNEIWGIFLMVAFAVLDPPSLLVTIPLEAINFMGQTIEDILLSSHSSPTINTTNLSVTFNASSKYVLDGDTIWYRGDDCTSLTALASGETFQLTDSLSSNSIDGSVVVDNKIGGLITKFVPFYTSTNKLYVRKLADQSILPPTRFLFLNEFNDALMTDNGNVWFVASGSIVGFNRASGAYVGKTLWPLDTTSPIDQHYKIDGITMLVAAKILVVLSGCQIYVYRCANPNSFDTGFQLIAVIDLRISLTNYSDFATNFYNIASITDDFDGQDPNTIIVFQEDLMAKIVFDPTFQSATFVMTSVQNWRYRFTGILGPLDAAYVNHATKQLEIVIDKTLYTFAIQGGAAVASIPTANFTQPYNTANDRIFFSQNDIAILNVETKTVFLATANDYCYGDLDRTFVVRQVDEYFDRDYLLGQSVEPSQSTVIHYDVNSMIVDHAAGIIFGKVVIEEKSPKATTTKAKVAKARTNLK